MSIYTRERIGYFSILYNKFKPFLYKNLGNSKTFVNSIWSKLKDDSQYQLEDVQDWASHLEHLQSILLEFDGKDALKESDLICFFQKGLQLSIVAEIEMLDQEYKN